MELSAPTVNDILLKAERRLSKISPSEHNSADPIDNLENPPQELKVRGDGSKHPAATALEPRFVPSKTTQQVSSLFSRFIPSPLPLPNDENPFDI